MKPSDKAGLTALSSTSWVTLSQGLKLCKFHELVWTRGMPPRLQSQPRGQRQSFLTLAQHLVYADPRQNTVHSFYFAATSEMAVVAHTPLFVYLTVSTCREGPIPAHPLSDCSCKDHE